MQKLPIAIISNGMPPYRLHLHARIAREMPEVRLFSILTHDDGTAKWNLDLPREIGPHHFGPGESSSLRSNPLRQPHEFLKAGRIIRFMQEQEIGAVIVCGYSDLGRLRIIRWCRRHGIPCFISADSNIRCDYARGIVLWAKRILVGWCIRNTAGLLPFGSLGQQFFEKYGANPDRIWFFPLEPDYALIENLSQDRIDRVRKKFGWNPLRRRLVFSGRLIGLKRVDLLIDAFNVVAPQRQDWDLVIVGDGPLRGALESRLMPSIADRVIWAGFQPEQADVAAIYRCCDVLVLPSDYEAWGLVVNEAMTAGLALVCSNIVGATAELVHNGENGYAFVRGDGDALIRAMMNITEPKNTEKLRRGSALILKSWRQEGNPISGLRRALETTLAHKWASAAADQFNHSPDRASAAGASDC